MDIIISRSGVCMGDDVEDHTIIYPVQASDRFSDVFQDLIQRGYFPSVSGNNVIWRCFAERMI